MLKEVNIEELVSGDVIVIEERYSKSPMKVFRGQFIDYDNKYLYYINVLRSGVEISNIRHIYKQLDD